MNSAYTEFEKQYISRTKGSRKLFDRARDFLAGGVSGSGANRSPYPLYVNEARGARVWDVDGNEYIDIMLSGGPSILGHSPPKIMDVVRRELDRGTVTLVTNRTAVDLAEKITEHMPGMDLVRFVNSGSEGVQMALRTARAYTGRNRFAKFEGHYHGQLDSVLVSGGAFGGPESGPEPVVQGAGLPQGIAENVLVLPWNKPDLCTRLIKKHGNQLAALILEPVAGMYLGGVGAEKEFHQLLRNLCHEYGIILIYDEVVTGFRLSLAGAYPYTETVPDLRVLGKLIGGGFPIGAYGGRRDIMEKVVADIKAPALAGPHGGKPKIVQSGTFSGNPISMIAGLTMIKELETPGFYDRINGYGKQVRDGLRRSASKNGVPMQVVGVASMFCAHFCAHPVKSLRDLAKTDQENGAAFYMGLVANGVHSPPFHLGFTCSAHDERDIKALLHVTDMIIEKISRAAGQVA